MADPPGEPDEVVFRIDRARLFLIGGLVIGVLLGGAAGVVVARSTLDPRTVTSPPVVLGGAAGVGTTPSSMVAGAAPVKIGTAGRPRRGPADAKVTMIEFVDFQCPFCGRFARETLPQIQKAFGGRVAFVVRQFPLEAIHPFARPAARAAECAGAQGRFFAYYDVLFRHQARLAAPDLERYARSAAVPDSVAFDRCLRAPAVDRRIDADLAAGAVAGVTSTPTFFVNGIKLTGAQPYPAFKAALDLALRK